jgi:signal transduction histidine kinase
MEEGRVLLLPATRRDGEAVSTILTKASIASFSCENAAQVAAQMEKGAAALLLTDAVLADPNLDLIVQPLLRQPAWSDLPVVLLSQLGTSLEMASQIPRLTNVTLIERPTSTRTLLSAIRTALRARGRQYQMRDHLVALQSAQDALRQSDRRKDEFLAMLAHELRNPLAPIRTASELLAQILPAGDDRIASTLRVLRRQVRQLTRLVDDLLDVSRITQGRIELQRAVVDLASVVAQALEGVEPLMTERSHTVLRQAHLPALYVQGDSARLIQCLSNILTNAAKYTDPGGKIQVALHQQGDTAVLSVQDNGIGMPPELLSKAFDLFVQSERSLDRSQGGLGIGLSVVRRLIEMHDGKVSAKSAGLGQGSSFEIRLPLVAAPAIEAPPARPHPKSVKRVLIVDDNQDAADSLSMLLQIQGHDVQTAYGAQDALDRAAAFDADVVLLDIGLPMMNGFEVARRLRASGNPARLVALSGYGQPQDIRRTRNAGFDAHLVKPVDLEQVDAVLAGSHRRAV